MTRMASFLLTVLGNNGLLLMSVRKMAGRR